MWLYFKWNFEVLVIGYLIDAVLGDPQKMPHIVRWIGKLIGKTENAVSKTLHLNLETGERNPKKERLGGAILVFFVILVTLVLGLSLLWLHSKIHLYAVYVYGGVVSYQMLAAKSLKKESMKVYYALENSLEEARKCLSMIVGRDTANLDEKAVIRACVETVAENCSDGVIAPAFYILLFGPVGGLVYKAVNTMDSMIGYKNDKYRYFGTVAARLDDLLNLVPARLSAILMIIVSFAMYDGIGAIKIYARDRYNHKSPNSAHGEAVVAGALNIRLGGPSSYFGKMVEKPYIGDDKRAPERTDIIKACLIMQGSAVLFIIATAMILYLVKRYGAV